MSDKEFFAEILERVERLARANGRLESETLEYAAQIDKLESQNDRLMAALDTLAREKITVTSDQ